MSANATVPSGTPVRLCECGCGQPTPTYRDTDRSRGYVAGAPARFVHGHGLRGSKPYREVPTSVLRKAFVRSGMTKADIARNLDWYDQRGYANGDRVARAIGLKTENMGHGYGRKRRLTTTYERAVAIVLAMGLDPVDYDL